MLDMGEAENGYFPNMGDDRQGRTLPLTGNITILFTFHRSKQFVVQSSIVNILRGLFIVI